MHRSMEAWLDEYKRRHALWITEGEAPPEHTLLTSGLHSTGYFNSELVMEDPLLLHQATADLLDLLIQEPGFRMDRVNRVVGPAMGAITLAHNLALHLTIHSSPKHVCFRAYAERDPLDRTRFLFDRNPVHPGEIVLLCEDVVTTGGSTQKVAQAVLEMGATPLPFVAVLVNRSPEGSQNLYGRKVVSLINCPMPAWPPEECPLCKKESKPLRPKEHWARLNAS